MDNCKSRKALVVGINNYSTKNSNLSCCINDAKKVAELLELNYDEERNFSIITLLDEEATRNSIMDNLKKAFDDSSDISLFYFSGHGFDDETDGAICDYEFFKNKIGIKFNEICGIVQKSKSKNKIIILDCCFAGKMGDFSVIGDQTILNCGTTILTACNKKESSIAYKDYSLFTGLLIDALNGGASDIFGRITPGSIYSYIDSSLGSFEQRPLFKSYVQSFVTIRKAKEKMSAKEIRKIMTLFNNENYLYQLNSSYEPTNYLGSKGIGECDIKEPYFNKINGEIFALLQKAVSNGLIKPSKEKHMFNAAMNSDTCGLTELGKHYWWLVHKKIV